MFNHITNIKYDINRTKTPVDAKNIFTYAYILKKYMRDSRNIVHYVLQSGDTPENLAYRYYGDPKLSWIILLANDIKDVYSEWPQHDTEVLDTILAQYRPDKMPHKKLKRIDQLPQLPQVGFDGQVVYVENTDKTYEWAAGTNSWNFVYNGLPKRATYDQEFTMTLNDYYAPTAINVSTPTSPEPMGGKTITVYRNHTAVFNVWFSNQTKFYLSTRAIGAWQKNAYVGEYREGLNISRLGDGVATWEVPADAPDYIYYHCSDTGASGRINVVNATSQHYVEGTDSNSLDGYNGRGAGNLARIKDSWYIWNGLYISPQTDSFRSGWIPLAKELRVLPLDIAKKTPVHYTHNDLGHNISNESYALLENVERLSYTMFSRWDEKHKENEKFREIKIIRQEIADKFVKEWKRIIK